MLKVYDLIFWCHRELKLRGCMITAILQCFSHRDAKVLILPWIFCSCSDYLSDTACFWPWTSGSHHLLWGCGHCTSCHAVRKPEKWSHKQGWESCSIACEDSQQLGTKCCWHRLESWRHWLEVSSFLGPTTKNSSGGMFINLNGLLERESSCKKQEWDNELRKDIHSK